MGNLDPLLEDKGVLMVAAAACAQTQRSAQTSVSRVILTYRAKAVAVIHTTAVALQLQVAEVAKLARMARSGLACSHCEVEVLQWYSLVRLTTRMRLYLSYSLAAALLPDLARWAGVAFGL